MTIGEIITKHYNEFRAMVRTDIVIVNSKTQEDILQDVMITTLKKFKGEIEEKEGYDYIKKTLQCEQFYSYRRKKADKLIFTDEPLGL